MSSSMPRHLLRVSGCLLAGIAFLALGIDVSFARHRHHHSGKSGVVASDAKTVVPSVSAPINLSAPSGSSGGNRPGPGLDASRAAKHGTDPGDKGVFERPGKKPPKTGDKSGDFTKGDEDARRTYFHSQ